MIVYLRLLSTEADDFVKEMAIDNDQTFADLHQFIQQTLGYDATQMASFFTTDCDWNKETEVTLFDMGLAESESILVMQDTKLSQLVNEEGQRFLYVYDFFSERAFFMEAYHVADGQLETPKCFRNEGITPEQIMEIDHSIDFKSSDAALDFDDDLDYMNDHFSYEELSDDHFNENDYHDDY